MLTMAVDLAERLDLAPELRMASSAYREEFDGPPALVWQVPGTVTLLADGPLQLTVTAPWGAIGAAGPGRGDIIELARMEQPGEKVRLPGTDAGASRAWAGTGPGPTPTGVALLTRTELPEGTGLGAAAATETAIRLCLQGEAPVSPEDSGPHAMAGSQRLPFDLATAGLRLMVIDTRTRDTPQQAAVEHSPVQATADAIKAGALTALGPALTGAHDSLACDEVQQIAVSAALSAGALGARAIIDGPGRPVCALVPVGRLTDIRSGVAAEFARRLLRLPRFLTFTPAGGPRCFQA
jgi:galactokinase